MFMMRNFVMPSDPHMKHKEKEVPIVVFKPKKEAVKKENDQPKLKTEKPIEKPLAVEKKMESVRVPEAQEKSIPVEKPVEAPKATATKKKIRFEKGSQDAIEWGKEMSMRRKLKKEGTMKEKVVDVKPETEKVIMESVKPNVEVKA